MTNEYDSNSITAEEKAWYEYHEELMRRDERASALRKDVEFWLRLAKEAEANLCEAYDRLTSMEGNPPAAPAPRKVTNRPALGAFRGLKRFTGTDEF